MYIGRSPANDCLDWADKEITTACDSNDLAMNSFLLVFKYEGGKPGLAELFNWDGEQMWASVTNEKLGVIEPKGCLVVVSIK